LCMPGIESWLSNPQPVTVLTELSWHLNVNMLLCNTYSLGSNGLQPAPLHHSSHLFNAYSVWWSHWQSFSIMCRNRVDILTVI
jgi:hypothetical protein